MYQLVRYKKKKHSDVIYHVSELGFKPQTVNILKYFYTYQIWLSLIYFRVSIEN